MAIAEATEQLASVTAEERAQRANVESFKNRLRQAQSEVSNLRVRVICENQKSKSSNYKILKINLNFRKNHRDKETISIAKLED
jgi:hypothetical protein